MQTITGTIDQIGSLVLEGKTIHFFTLIPTWSKLIGGGNQVCAAVFVESVQRTAVYAGFTNRLTPTQLSLKLAGLKEGATAEISVDTDKPIGTADKADFSSQIYVTDIKLVQQSSPPTRRTGGVLPQG